MTSPILSRRDLSLAAGSIMASFAVVENARSQSPENQASPPEDPGISHANAAIHQAVVFKTSAGRVYHVLTDAREFDKVVLLSGALQAMSLPATPSLISPAPGGEF